MTFFFLGRRLVGLVFAFLLLAAGGTTLGFARAQDSSKPHLLHKDWRWVRGAVFVPTNCVNEAQQWDEYDPQINDRELHYAAFYGLNCVRVFLSYDIYLKKKAALMHEIEDFLQRANKYGLKTEFVFFDDDWNQPPPDLLSSSYRYPAPIYGIHNSRWLASPGDVVKSNLDTHRETLRRYVQDIVRAHRADSRIAFWEIDNEPNPSRETHQLLQAAAKWIRGTGTTIPVTATAGNYAGAPFSDFITWHDYGSRYALGGDQEALCTECLNRQDQSVEGIVDHYRSRTGFIMWELGIGRDNCRFPWRNDHDHPATKEPQQPFHGLIFPDGHPWSVDEIKILMGEKAFSEAPLFHVRYFNGENFDDAVKSSVTPLIDFDLPDEPGTGSPDGPAGVHARDYSVMWTGRLFAPAAGRYTFYADCDDRVQVYLDSHLIVARMPSQTEKVSTAVQLSAHQSCAIKILYQHGKGASRLHLEWSGPGGSRRILLPSRE